MKIQSYSPHPERVLKIFSALGAPFSFFIIILFSKEEEDRLRLPVYLAGGRALLQASDETL